MRGPQHEFCAKMKFPAQKNKNSSVNGTTSLAVIVGPKCLIAHLLAPHDRAFSQEKIDKYRAGYAALDVRRAFLPAVVSTSGRIHGDLLRLLYLIADNKTKRHFRDRHEAIDDDSEAYCWRRSNPRSRAGRTSA